MRCRPSDRNRCVECADHGGNHIAIKHAHYSKEFLYDGVFSEKSHQEEVYKKVGQPVVEHVMKGVNGCILAYGPTGSGKTYSLCDEWKFT